MSHCLMGPCGNIQGPKADYYKPKKFILGICWVYFGPKLALQLLKIVLQTSNKSLHNAVLNAFLFLFFVFAIRLF